MKRGAVSFALKLVIRMEDGGVRDASVWMKDQEEITLEWLS